MAARAAFLGAALATSGAAFAPPGRLRAPPTALRAADATCDVAVVGAGPAGSALAWLLGEREGLDVALVDAAADAPWPNNYGVWKEEWAALDALYPELGLAGCVDEEWATTECFFGGSWDMPLDARTVLDRAYCRVDREKLRGTLRARSAEKNVRTVAKAVAVGGGPRWASNVVRGVAHDADGSTLELVDDKGTTSTLRATVVVDATGAESALTSRRGPDVGDAVPDPGYQIAYGFEALVDDLGPYADDAMLLFDYRTDHLTAGEQRDSPTFMYAMPLGVEDGRRRVFFEETSLVARPALSVAECERRAFLRLDHIGVKIHERFYDDVEYCYIPMGGPRPDDRQRVVAFGAAAALVHPATGYQLCRALAAAGPVAAALGASLAARPGDADAAAAAAYGALWNRQNSLQREFALFGGEFLMTLDAEALRGWFAGFFALPQPVWAGFLAGWPGLPGNEHHESRAARLAFGVSLLPKLPPAIALKLAAFIATYSLAHGPALLRSVVPFFGDGDYFGEATEPDRPPPGDAAVKAEIRAKLQNPGPH